MALFLAEHQHRHETCLTSNAEMARGPASHVTASNASKYGVNLLPDCVLQGEDILLMVVEAESPDKMAALATPFMNIAPTTIRHAITCEIVASCGRD